MNNVQQELSLDLQPNLVMGSTKGVIKSLGGSSIDLWTVPIGSIDQIRIIEDFNVRVKDEAYYADIRKYATDMKNNGYKKDKPLSAFVSKENGMDILNLTDGHRRLESLKLALSEGAEITHFPVLTCAKAKSFEDLTVDLVTNNNGTKLSPFETAIVCKRLVNYGWAEEKIALRLGFSIQYISDLLFLMSAPKPIRDMVQNAQVTAGAAIDLLRSHGSNAISILEAGLDRATAAGKTKVTDKYIPGRQYAKFVKKSAPAMVSTLREVQLDPSFSTLSAETRTKLEDLLTLLSEEETKDKLPE